MMEYWNGGVMNCSRSTRCSPALCFLMPRILLPAVLVLAAGCAGLVSEPGLSAEVRAEALACFSQALLAEANDDSEAALELLQNAIRLDPDADILYGPAVATALQLERPADALQMARQLRDRRPESLMPRLLQARVFALTDQPDRAEEAFRKAAGLFPQDAEAPLYLARFYVTRDESERAIAVLQAALPRHRDNPEILNLLGTLYADRARNIPDAAGAAAATEKGVALLEQALAIDPSDPRRWQQLGFAQMAVDEPKRALASFEQAHELAPGDLLIARMVLELTLRSRQPERALELYDRLARQTGTDPERWLQTIIEKLPADRRSLLIDHLVRYIREHSDPAVFYYSQLGALYLDSGQLQEAEAVLREGLARDPGELRLRAVLGYLKLQQEDYEEAYHELEAVRTAETPPEQAHHPFFLVNCLVAAQQCGRLEQAADILTEAYAGDPAILTFYMRALLTGQVPGSISSAIELIQAFRDRNPDMPDPFYYLAVLHRDQKDYPGALLHARQFEALARDRGQTNLLNGSFYYEYAALHERNGQLEEAESLFRKAIELDETAAAAARNYIAYMWAERGEKLEMALGLVRQALAEEPDNGAFLDTLGWVYYMQGRYAEALEQLQKAREQVADDPTVWEHLGDTWMKLNDRAAAVEHWKKALELAPDAAHLQERIRKNTP